MGDVFCPSKQHHVFPFTASLAPQVYTKIEVAPAEPGHPQAWTFVRVSLRVGLDSCRPLSSLAVGGLSSRPASAPLAGRTPIAFSKITNGGKETFSIGRVPFSSLHGQPVPKSRDLAQVGDKSTTSANSASRTREGNATIVSPVASSRCVFVCLKIIKNSSKAKPKNKWQFEVVFLLDPGYRVKTGRTHLLRFPPIESKIREVRKTQPRGFVVGGGQTYAHHEQWRV